MIVPLGLKAYRRGSGFTPETVLRNLYLEKDESGLSPDQTMRVQRPGLTRLRTLPGVVRGMDHRLTTAEALAVAGGQLYAGEAAKGAIAGTDPVAMVGTNFTHAIVGGGVLHLYDTTVTPVSLPDARSAQDVDQLNQYVLVLTPTGRFYWIEPGAATIDPLNFATAESSADKGVALRRVGDEFWIFGERSVEPWQATGDQDAPFQPAVGRVYERGCLARDTVRRFDNSVMWVTNDGQVARGGAVPQIVSDPALAERIRQRNALPSAWVFTVDGHELYCLDIPGQGSFAYDALTQSWCEFASPTGIGWAARYGYDHDGETVCGGGSAIWRLDPAAATDDGVAFERTVTGTVAIMGRTGRNDSFSFGMGASAACKARLRWKDGQDDYPAVYEELDVRAPHDVVNLHRLGMPEQPHRTFEISCVDPVRIRIAGAKANEAWA